MTIQRFASIAAAALLVLAPLDDASALFGAKGMSEYEKHDFDGAIDKCKGEKDRHCRLLLGLAHTEKYGIYKNKTDKEQAKMYLDILKVDLKLDDVDTLEPFLGVSGNPNGNKEAAKLLKSMLGNAPTTPDNVMLVARFLSMDYGEDVVNIALDAIGKRLGPVRDYVNKGGTMPKEMKKLFEDDKLIEPLVAALAEKKTAGGAKKCLTYIEDPALEHLEKRELTKEVGDAIASVKKAALKRLKKYPNSTWYSAAGE